MQSRGWGEQRNEKGDSKGINGRLLWSSGHLACFVGCTASGFSALNWSQSIFDFVCMARTGDAHPLIPTRQREAQRGTERQTDTHTHTYEHTQTHTHVRAHAHTYEHTRTHTHVRAHAHTHTHRQTKVLMDCFLLMSPMMPSSASPLNMNDTAAVNRARGIAGNQAK